MSEYAEKMIYGLLSILCGMGLWLWNWNSRRHDGHDIIHKDIYQQIRGIEQASITRDTIIRIENDWRDEVKLLRDERKDNHKENSRRLDNLDAKLDSVLKQMIESSRQPR